MERYNLCFLGFGNVGRALARLFVAKSADLRQLYGIDWRITGVATRRLGWLSNSERRGARDDFVECGNGPTSDRLSTHGFARGCTRYYSEQGHSGLCI